MADKKSVGYAPRSTLTAAQRGFSLLELLVVLVIAGLLTTLSVAWLDSGQASQQQALQRLAAASQAQAGLAVHAGQVHGLRWNGQRPEFVRQVRDGNGLRWQLENVELGEWPSSLHADWPPSSEPRLLYTPAGIASPQALRWQWPDGAEQWQWNSLGQLQRTLLP